eukprot:184907-Chlamydomonas_euryale.AAC.5
MAAVAAASEAGALARPCLHALPRRKRGCGPSSGSNTSRQVRPAALQRTHVGRTGGGSAGGVPPTRTKEAGRDCARSRGEWCNGRGLGAARQAQDWFTERAVMARKWRGDHNAVKC